MVNRPKKKYKALYNRETQRTPMQMQCPSCRHMRRRFLAAQATITVDVKGKPVKRDVTILICAPCMRKAANKRRKG